MVLIIGRIPKWLEFYVGSSLLRSSGQPNQDAISIHDL